MPSVLAMETDAIEKRRGYAGILREPRSVTPPDPEGIEQRLRMMRSEALARQAELTERALAVWSGDREVELTVAEDAREAVRAIAAVSGPTRRIAINKSSVVRGELVPPLRAAGFRIIEPYYEQFPAFENRFTEAWQLPDIPLALHHEAFHVTDALTEVRRHSIERRGTKEIVGVLGVNAASASDGAIVLMQHGHNISEIFAEAREIVVVIGIEKIVPDRQSAVFQARCMALYGWGALLLDLRYREPTDESFEKLPFAVPPGSSGRKVHLILLDNGRRRLLSGRYRDLLLCIDCRACARACPVGEIEARRGDARRSPKEYLYARVLRMDTPSRACLQCRRCEGVCPVGIELPDLIREASGKAGLKLPGGLSDYLLGNPEALLRRASALSAGYNPLSGSGAFRWLGEKTMGIAKERRPPKARQETFARWFHSRSGGASRRRRDGE